MLREGFGLVHVAVVDNAQPCVMLRVRAQES